jgi:YidC/Oxa1 family membrane protein insertase
LYGDEHVRIEKKFTTGETPYTLRLRLTLTNLSEQTGSYALSVGTSAYLLDEDVESQMFRMNPRMTHVECLSTDGKMTRELTDAFEPDEFDDKEHFPKNSINPGDFSQPPGQAQLVAVSNAYFTDAVTHDKGPTQPECLLQIDHRYRADQFPSAKEDPLSGAIYTARLAYEPTDLKAGQSATFEYKSFIGPKERKALAAAGERFEPIIDLGFFSVIAKVLVGYLLWLYDLVPSWGIAIVLRTITARILHFPLTWPSLTNTVHMRELKP